MSGAGGTDDPPPDGIEPAGVERWFLEHVKGVTPPLAYERITGGHSNLTYAVSDAAGRRWALRRPPLGRRLASAHDMGREHRLMSALAPTPVPVPAIAGFCEDEQVTGAPFFVSDFVEGAVLRSSAEAERFEPAVRHAIGGRLIDTLADIHAVDPDAVGLGELGRREGYVARQLNRWAGQWERSKTRELPLIEDVHGRLAACIPDQGPACIVHGDYRLDNVILAPDGSLAAVLDWELATLGDPLADVGTLMVYWAEPGEQLAMPGAPTTAAGFPTRAELRERYAERAGRDLAGLDFYVALGYWKLAIILEGVLRRYAAGGYGQAGTVAEGFARTVEQLATAADEAARRLG